MVGSISHGQNDRVSIFAADVDKKKKKTISWDLLGLGASCRVNNVTGSIFPSLAPKSSNLECAWRPSGAPAYTETKSDSETNNWIQLVQQIYNISLKKLLTQIEWVPTPTCWNMVSKSTINRVSRHVESWKMYENAAYSSVYDSLWNQELNNSSQTQTCLLFIHNLAHHKRNCIDPPQIVSKHIRTQTIANPETQTSKTCTTMSSWAWYYQYMWKCEKI